MIPEKRPEGSKYLHIAVYPLHRELIYLIPTIQLDTKPLNGDKFHARFYLFTWVIQIEILNSKKKAGVMF
jgi:hypothetical protein